MLVASGRVGFWKTCEASGCRHLSPVEALYYKPETRNPKHRASVGRDASRPTSGYPDMMLGINMSYSLNSFDRGYREDSIGLLYSGLSRGILGV